MTSLEELTEVIDADTRAAWPHVAAAVPPDATLMGGTGLAVHLRHRRSRDLDVFTEQPFDADQVEARLRRRGRFATSMKGDGTLNGVFGATKVQVLWAVGQRTLEPATEVAGMSVGSLADIFATKLKVLVDRGELRDYVDLMSIEQRAGRFVEEGLQLYMARYRVDETHTSVAGIVRSLGYLDDVADDPSLVRDLGPDIRINVETYWKRRQAEIVASFDARP